MHGAIDLKVDVNRALFVSHPVAESDSFRYHAFQRRDKTVDACLQHPLDPNRIRVLQQSKR